MWHNRPRLCEVSYALYTAEGGCATRKHVMLRAAAIGCLISTILATLPMSWASPASTAPPVTYEVQINGETFRVEANRVMKVESKKTPGVAYNVAVRVAPIQRVRLNTVQFEYELPAKVEDNGKRENRSARLTHELGFSILFNDLGTPLEPQAVEGTLKLLVDSVTAELREEKAVGIEVSVPRQHKFDGSDAGGDDPLSRCEPHRPRLSALCADRSNICGYLCSRVPRER